MGTNLHRQVHSMQMLHLPRVVKAFAISVKTGFTSFGKVDLPFHAPVSQQSVKTRRHSSTGLEFYDHQENDFTPKKSTFPYRIRFSHFVPQQIHSLLHTVRFSYASYRLNWLFFNVIRDIISHFNKHAICLTKSWINNCQLHKIHYNSAHQHWRELQYWDGQRLYG